MRPRTLHLSWRRLWIPWRPQAKSSHAFLKLPPVIISAQIPSPLLLSILGPTTTVHPINPLLSLQTHCNPPHFHSRPGFFIQRTAPPCLCSRMQAPFASSPLGSVSLNSIHQHQQHPFGPVTQSCYVHQTHGDAHFKGDLSCLFCRLQDTCYPPRMSLRDDRSLRTMDHLQTSL